MSGASTLSSGSGQHPSTLGSIDESIQQLLGQAAALGSTIGGGGTTQITPFIAETVRQLVNTLAGTAGGSAPASPTAAAGGYPSTASRAARVELPEVEELT